MMDKPSNTDMVIYSDGELELNVSVGNDTVWLNRNQIAELFGRDVKTIGKHIGNVFSDRELEQFSTVAKFATVQKEGEREVLREIEYYNLDVIISVGYRVKSQKGVRFRQWATNVLKSYIQNGYVINADKITNDRFVSLENEVSLLKSQMANISKGLENSSIQPKHGIFYDGQIYDAYAFVNDLLKSAKNEVILIDNYIDDTVFTLFSKYLHVKIKIYTQTISIGASLKDLGKKWFAFSKFEVEALDVFGRLK